MTNNVPVQMPFEGGQIGLNFGVAHYYVSCLKTAIEHFKARNQSVENLILQIPLPLRGVLAQITAPVLDNSPYASLYEDVKIFGVKCLPAYEARIVLYNPAEAFYAKSLIAVIDFEVEAGLCQRPVLRFVE